MRRPYRIGSPASRWDSRRRRASSSASTPLGGRVGSIQLRRCGMSNDDDLGIICVMTSERIISEALTLPPADRLDVIERLWDSLTAIPEALELTDPQRQELERRISEMDANPGVGIPWEQVKAERHNSQ